MSEAHEKVELTIDDGVGIIAFSNTKLNFLSMKLRAEIESALEKLHNNDEVRVLILYGKGGKAFSVGSDIKEFKPGKGYGLERNREEHRVFNKLRDFPLPTIAAIEGYALGGGLELALTCDIRIASEQSVLGVPEVKLGLFPGGGGSQHLVRLVGVSKAKELMYTGDPISASEAWRINLVNRLAPVGKALEAAESLAKDIASRSGLALRVIKDVADRGVELPLKESFELEIEGSEKLFAGEDVLEGIKAFKEKRPPHFKHR